MRFDDQSPPHRVAIYAAPPVSSAFWLAGSHWLGRCAHTGQALTQPVVAGWSARALADLTADPRRYGWHATLKAPFRLAPGHTLQTLCDALQRLCAGRTPVDWPALQVQTMGRFLALRPQTDSPALHALAADCVRQLQSLAMPLTADELARRRRAGLSPQQDALLQAWGYPHVLDAFRVHWSLTGPLEPDVHDRDAQMALTEAAMRHFQGVTVPPLHALSVFIEPEPGANFRLVAQVELGHA